MAKGPGRYDKEDLSHKPDDWTYKIVIDRDREGNLAGVGVVLVAPERETCQNHGPSAGE